MAMYVDLYSERDQAIELATFVSKLKSKGNETVQNIVNLSAPIKDAEILEKVLKETSILFSDASEKEVESFYFAATALAKKLDNSQQLLTQIVNTIIANPEDKSSFRIKLLNNLYNTLPSNGSLRYTVYEALLKLAATTKNGESIFSQIKENELDARIAEWKLTPKQKQDLFAQIRDMAASTNSANHFKWKVKYLASLPVDGAELTNSLNEASKVVVDAIRTNYQFDTLMSSSVPIVSKLESSSDSKHTLTYQLLKIFASGNQETYQAFSSKNPNFVSSIGLNSDEVSRRIRLLTLASLASSALSSNSGSTVPEIPYSTIAKSLQVGENEVEMWIITAISEKVIIARMDQLRKIIVVTASLQRAFSNNEWKQVSDSLAAWRKNVKVMLNTLQETKQNPSQQHPAFSRALQQTST